MKHPRCTRPRFFSRTHALQGMAPAGACWYCPFCRHHHRDQWSDALSAGLQRAGVREVYVLSRVVDEELEAA